MASLLLLLAVAAGILYLIAKGLSGSTATVIDRPRPIPRTSPSEYSTFSNSVMSAQIQHPIDWRAIGPPTKGSLAQRYRALFLSPDGQTSVILFAHVQPPPRMPFSEAPAAMVGQIKSDFTEYRFGPVTTSSINGTPDITLSGGTRTAPAPGGRLEVTAVPDPSGQFVDELFLYTPDSDYESSFSTYERMLASLRFLPIS